MRKGSGLAGVFLLSMIAAGSAEAGKPAPAQQFAAVLQNPGHLQLVLQSAQATPAWTHLACAGAVFTPAPQIAVYVPIVFDSTGAPVRGEWREALIASGCGAPMTLNVLTKITDPATLATGYLLPGSTVADPILQNAAQGPAIKAAGGVPAGCRQAYIANTEFVGYEGPNAAKQSAGKQMGPWKELWTLDLCGSPRQVMLHFVADATGVAINAFPASAAP